MKKFRLIAAAMAAVMCISAVPVSAVQHGWESGEGTGRYILHDGAAAKGAASHRRYEHRRRGISL